MKDAELKRRLIQMADGTLVERDVLNIVERIRDYDSNLRVKYVDPSRAKPGDAPYRITEVCRDGLERVVFSVWELDERVLERLYAADTNKLDVLGIIDNSNLKAEMAAKQRYQESIDEAHDIVEHYLRSPKSTYTFVQPETGNLIKIDDQEGRKHKVVENGC